MAYMDSGSGQKPTHVAKLQSPKLVVTKVARGRKNLVDLLLEDAVFHSDSIILYKDRTTSFGEVHNKPIADVLPITILKDGLEKLREVMLWHDWPLADARMEAYRLKEKIKEERGDYMAHYDQAERNMLKAAAEIAARQPETSALYVPEFIHISDKANPAELPKAIELLPEEYDANAAPAALVATDQQRLRFIISPDNDIRKAGATDIAVSGTMFIPSSTVLASHPQDKLDWGATTIHELVHAFDIKNGITAQHMTEVLETKMFFTVGDAEELMEDWSQHRPLEEDQKYQIQRWQELLRTIPPEDMVLLNPDNRKPNDPDFGLSAFASFVQVLRPMIHLDKEVYKTPASRRQEYLPIFEEAARLYNKDPLDPDAPSRRLAAFIAPSIAELSRKHYLPKLTEEYHKALDSGQFEIRNKPVLRFNMVKRPRPKEDGAFTDKEKQALNLARNKLQRVMIEIDNFYPQPPVVAQQDDIIEAMRELYEKAYDRNPPSSGSVEAVADLMVFREIAQIQKAIDDARAKLEAGQSWGRGEPKA